MALQRGGLEKGEVKHPGGRLSGVRQEEGKGSGGKRGVKSKGVATQMRSFEKKIGQKVAMVC
jgi:hypothetical protein